MSTTYADNRLPQPLVSFSDVPLIAWCVMGVALLLGLDVYADSNRILKALGDTDDATRLTQVRELLGGAPWFDTTLHRFGGPEPLVSHWSRLIDLPIAALIMLFSVVASQGTAELAARLVWPLLVLLPTTYLVARAVEAQAGRAGALTSIFLVVTAFSAFGQFIPGRIDHHNAMILGAVGGILLLAESFTRPRMAWTAGALLGFGTAVGYEALALTVAALVLTNLYAIVSGRGGEAAWRVSVAFAATLSAALVITASPSQMLVPRCDAISPNLAILALIAAGGSFAVMRPLRGAALPVRLGILGGAGLVGAAIYAAIEPACLKGPFGQTYAAAVPIWLDHVLESQPITKLLRTTPATAVSAILFLGLGHWAAFDIARRERSDGSYLLAAAMVVGAALACWQIKFMPYATLLSALSLAIVITRLAARSPAMPNVAHVLGMVLLSEAFLFMIAEPALEATGWSAKTAKAEHTGIRDCLASKAYEPLSGLEPGLAVSDVDLGPFLVALTRLDTLAAPYHRIGKAVVQAETIFNGPEDAAERDARALGARYVVVCGGLPLNGSPATKRVAGLRSALLHGETPSWLEPVALPDKTVLQVWRVK